jgi:hypothetical protein
MRHSIGIVLISASFAFAFHDSTSYAQAPAHKPITPLAPNELLKLLPGAPQQWKLTASNASNSFSDWLTSRATRTFTFTPPSAPSAPSAAPQITRTTITDTGYFPQATTQFTAFRPGKENDVEKSFINSLPAIKISRGATEILNVLIKGRFIVQIRTDNQKPNSSESWLKLFDIGRIAALPDSGDEKIPQPVTIITIDELDPKKNTSYPLIWASEEQQRQAILQEQAEEKAKKPR